MTERIFSLLVAGGTLLWVGSLHAQNAADCRLPWPPEEATKKLAGLRPTSAATWTPVQVELLGCNEAGRRRLYLWLEPPTKWSRLGLVYRQALERWLEPDGRPANGGPQPPFFPVKKSDIERLEASPSVRRFVERYPPIEAVLEQNGEGLSAVLRGRASASRPELKILLTNGRRDLVAGYSLPGIGGLPGRRELLRFAEALSDAYPHCRAQWVTAERLTAEGPAGETSNGAAASGVKSNDSAPPCNFPLGDCLEAPFRLEGLLSGKDCPERFSVVVNQQLVPEPRS